MKRKKMVSHIPIIVIGTLMNSRDWDQDTRPSQPSRHHMIQRNESKPRHNNRNENEFSMKSEDVHITFIWLIAPFR